MKNKIYILSISTMLMCANVFANNASAPCAPPRATASLEVNNVRTL